MKDPNSQNSIRANTSTAARKYARSWIRKVWDVRGGGLYAAGYIVCFLYFEATSIADDIAQLGNLFGHQFFQIIVQFFVDSIMNMVYAFMWPVYVVRIAPPYGPIALGLAFLIFPRYIKKPLERLIFGDDGTRDEPGADKDRADDDRGPPRA